MFVLNNKIDIPLYIQIYEQFREKILSGDLKCGSKLPSSRKLCTDLSVSRNTVDTAYQQLYSEGYVISKPRNGYYVQNLDFSSIHVTGETIYSSTNLSDNEDKSIIQYDFKYGKLSEGELPIHQWQKLTNKCLREFKSEMTSYGPTFGEPGLRKEILKYLHYYRGVKCTSDQIFIGAGVHYCLGMLCQLIRGSTTIAMEDPGYHITRSTFTNNGFNVEPISLDSSGLNVKELSLSNAKAVYVTPSHQYPLGIIMPISRRLELIEWALKNDSIIIEDDYSCHLRYNTKPIQSLQSLCSDKVVYIGSFSKFLFPTLRLSYMVIPAHMMDKFRSMFNGYPSSVPFIIQKTLELFMQQGHWESYLRKNNQLQKKKHDTLVETLRNEFGDKISIFGMNAGLHLLIQVKWAMSEEKLIERAYRVGVKVYPTSKFWKYPKGYSEGSVVLGFGGIELNQIAPAIELLRKAWLSN